MKRRLVLITCLLGIVGGSAGAALASPSTPKSPVETKMHDICVVFAQDSYTHTKYLCVDLP